MGTQKDLENYLATFPEKVQKNVNIVTPKSLGQDFLLHISKDTKIKKFIPYVSARQADSENRNIPRVVCAPTILGCILGYGAVEYDFLTRQAGLKEEKKMNYKGGYKIYGIPFELALAPNNRMVYDARNTDEHWLVAYSKDTVEYACETLGYFFVHSMELMGRTDKFPKGNWTIFVSVTDKDLQFSKRYLLTKGYWKLTGPIDRNTYAWDSDGEYKAEKVDKETYMSAKFLSADLLSFQDKLPQFMQWSTK